MNPLRRTLAAVLLSAAAFSAGCAAPAAEETQSGDSAATVGTRFHSPFTSGLYDSENVILDLYASLDAQVGNFTVSLDKGITYCDGRLDLTDGVWSVANLSGYPCKVTLIPSSSDKGIDLSGVFNGQTFKEHLAPRAASALNGRYVANGARLDISASSAKELSFKYQLVVGDLSYEGEARSADNDSPFSTAPTGAIYDGNTLGDCNVTFAATRKAGKFGFLTYPLGKTADTDACKALDLRFSK